MSTDISLGTLSISLPVVMVLQGPDFHQLEEPRGTPGHQCHDLLQAGPLEHAGLAGAVLCIGGPSRLASVSTQALSLPAAYPSA